MTNKNLTSINFLLDESGSMTRTREATIAGINAYMEDQKTDPGEVLVSLTKFSTTVSQLYTTIPLSTVPALSPATYMPHGGTALNDATAQTIDAVGERLAAMPEDERPDRVLFIIMTDGEENASRLFTREQVS